MGNDWMFFLCRFIWIEFLVSINSIRVVNNVNVYLLLDELDLAVNIVIV